jgi:hypothetical protein
VYNITLLSSLLECLQNIIMRTDIDILYSEVVDRLSINETLIDLLSVEALPVCCLGMTLNCIENLLIKTSSENELSKTYIDDFIKWEGFSSLEDLLQSNNQEVASSSERILNTFFQDTHTTNCEIYI